MTAKKTQELVDPQADFDDALARAFAKIGIAKKDNKGNFGRYADLASVTEALRGPLTEECFSWPQTVSMEDGLVVVTTRLRRKGVEIESVLPMPVGPKGGAHAIGSAITYARRYALAAIAGVCPDDDDGQRAQDSGGGGARRPQQSGPWRQRAPAEVKAKDKRFREICKERGALARDLHDLGVKHDIPADVKATIRKVLGADIHDGTKVPLEQWDALNAALLDEVSHLAQLKAEEEGSREEVAE